MTAFFDPSVEFGVKFEEMDGDDEEEEEAPKPSPSPIRGAEFEDRARAGTQALPARRAARAR